MIKTIKCFMCDGCGRIKLPDFKQKFMAEKIKTAKKMRGRGYSIREIMRAMNYKSPRSVTNLLDK